MLCVAGLPAMLHITGMGHLARNRRELLPSPYCVAGRSGVSTAFKSSSVEFYCPSTRYLQGAKPCMTVTPSPCQLGCLSPFLCSLRQGWAAGLLVAITSGHIRQAPAGVPMTLVFSCSPLQF